MSSKYIRLKDLNLKKVNYDNIEKNILIGSKYLERFKDMEKCSNSIIILDEKTNLLINYMKEYNKLLINSDETRKESKVLKDINSSIDKNLFKYRELLRRVEICPFCLSNIDDDKIEHIMNHYIGG